MEDGAPQCTCPSTCELSEKRSQPVCGTDRMTHGDACQLRIFACRLMRDIRVAHEGPCADDTTTRMPYQRPRKTTRHVSNHVTNRDSHSTLPYGDVGYFCKSDGDCFVDGTYCNSGRCSCRPGYEATADNAACQRSFDIMLSDAGTGYMIPSFSGNSYLELTKIHHGNSRITIEMTFRPLKPDGLLLFAAQDQTGNGDFISLSLVDGHVDFRYDLGSGISRLVSTSPVNMNVYHKVVAQRFGKNGMLQVNGGHEVSGVSPGALRSLNLKSPLFLGGLPIATSKVVENIGTEKSFVGCIEVLRITDEKNTKDYSLVYPASDDINLAVHIDECMDNPCDSSPCQNDGTCMALQTTYQCICPLKYSGLTCTVEQTLACESFPCAEGATCVDLPGGKFTCTCAGDQQGELCDQKIEIDVPQFNGASYLELKTTKNLETALNFEIWFLSTHPDGVLLYNEQDGEESGDFLSLNLVDGYLQFRFDLGSGMADIKSSFPVPLNTWNKVSIIRNEKQGVLTINGAESDNGQSKGSLKQLNLHKKFYLGGFPSAYHPDSGIISGFRGAIQRVYEDNILVDGLYDSSISSAGISPYLGPPCPPESNPCTNGGTCVPVLNDFQCRCTEGFSGKKCESTSVVRMKSNPVSFDGRTYHRYLNNINEKFRAESKNSFEIHFHTLGVRGLLLLVHKSETVAGDYLAIAINSGHLEVSFNLGKELSTELFSLRSPVRVNDGHWHTLTFKRDERSASLQVDNGDVIYGSSKEGANQLDTNGDLWIGGSRNPPEGLPKSYRSGFVGCIESVYVNDSPLDLDTDRVNFSPLNFCDV
ncbi:hypothetical protein CAPTEDRAFT_223648 [Capitella teleta]|uniref:Agrin n=1 Tax=Capitella teleta TaxID=283909 RepID=R7UWX5_CAPTE|nr:hypothetical protein CAPTEDRAFT_223648 [Capitella teleta]|eukprot:ELU10834.1 hypothetical protein CAPTEDRAFT_223648 [Capitella teleta]